MNANDSDLPLERLAEAFHEIPAQRFESLWSLLQDDLADAAHRLLEREEARSVTFTTTKLWHNALLGFLTDETFDTWLAKRDLPRWSDVVERDLTAEEGKIVVRLLVQRMSLLLRDRAKERAARKRGGGLTRHAIEDFAVGPAALESANPAAVVEASDMLSSISRQGLDRQVEAAQLRWIEGFSEDRIAQLLKVSKKTVQRYLKQIKSELRDRLRRERPSE